MMLLFSALRLIAIAVAASEALSVLAGETHIPRRNKHQHRRVLAAGIASSGSVTGANHATSTASLDVSASTTSTSLSAGRSSGSFSSSQSTTSTWARSTSSSRSFFQSSSLDYEESMSSSLGTASTTISDLTSTSTSTTSSGNASASLKPKIDRCNAVSKKDNPTGEADQIIQSQKR